MSTGGKYILESNQAGNQQDKYLLSQDLLNEQIRARELKCPKEPLFDYIGQTHEHFIKKYYKPTVAAAYEFRAEGSEIGFAFNNESRFSLSQYGDFICEIFLQINIGAMSVQNPLDRCGYYDFLGHRIIKNISMEFDQCTIDQYSGAAYDVFYNFFVPAEKKEAWKKCMGQETEIDCLVQQDVADEYREKKKIVAGLQTPKVTHAAHTLWIPIIFDFCRKPNTSIFSAKIPFGQRFLKIALRRLDECIYIQNGGGGGAINAPAISGQIWVNNIFIDDTIKKAIMPGKYSTFLRVFKEANFSALPGNSIQKLDDLRFPIEHMYIGLRPDSQLNLPTKAHLFCTATDVPVVFPIRIPTGIPLPPSQLAFRSTVYFNRQTNIVQMQFLTKSTEVVRQAPGQFFERPFILSKSYSPEDPGLLLVSFAEPKNHLLFGRGDDNISGYFNISNDREFYISYTSNAIGNIYILAYCLNWIDIYENGTVLIRYKS
jgi:hypothetical protein